MTRYIAATATAAICLWLAFVPARQATAGLTMPYDMDHFREIAYAQSIADGKLLADPFYRGATIWYNPLFAATIAVISKAASLDVPVAFVQAGPFVTALAQATFFAAAVCMVGPSAAVIALGLLLFAPPHDASAWNTPGVTPWLFPSVFAAIGFYLGLIVCWIAMRRQRLLWWAAVGAALGLCFLAHTAPALILGLCAVAAILLGPPAEGVSHRKWAALGLVTAAAVVVSAPFLYSIVVVYGLRVVHRDPLVWVWDDIAVTRAGAVLQGVLLSQVGVLRVAGLVVLMRRARLDAGAFLAVCWTIAAALLFGYGWVQQSVGFERVPPLVPQHHFYFYLTAAGRLLAGVGLWALIAGVMRVIAGRAPWPFIRRQEQTFGAALALVVVYAIVNANYDAYQQRPDLQEYRREAAEMTAEFAGTEVLKRLRRQTPPDAVVLANGIDSQYRVAPAGRAIVAVPSAQANPYFTTGGREAAQNRMLAALVEGDAETFHSFADQYEVTHVLLGPEDAAAVHKSLIGSTVRELSRRGGYVLFERIAAAAPRRQR